MWHHLPSLASVSSYVQCKCRIGLNVTTLLTLKFYISISLPRVSLSLLKLIFTFFSFLYLTFARRTWWDGFFLCPIFHYWKDFHRSEFCMKYSRTIHEVEACRARQESPPLSHTRSYSFPVAEGSILQCFGCKLFLILKSCHECHFKTEWGCAWCGCFIVSTFD